MFTVRSNHADATWRSGGAVTTRNASSTKRA